MADIPRPWPRLAVIEWVSVAVLFAMGVSFFLSNVNTTIGYTLIIVGAGSLVARVQMR